MKPEDYNFRDYDNIERVSPILEIDYGGRAMRLTYDNTAIFSFSEPYEALTQVFHNDPDMGVMTFFDSDDLLEQLRGYRFPEYKEPYPSEKDITEYFGWHSKVLERELGEVALGNEVEDWETEPYFEPPLDDDDDPPGYRPEDWGWD